jgi:excisionase family DNA binding protein
MSDSPLMTEREVEARLHLSRRYTYELIAKGAIGSHRFGKSIRVSEEQLQKYLDETAVPSRAA